jgi:uncharacterized membrane protein
MFTALKRSDPAAIDVAATVISSDAPPDVHPNGATPSRGSRWPHLTLPGCWGALFFACLSFTPSLVPRSGLVQGIVCGITAAIGYGLGVWAAAIWRAFPDRDPRPARRWTWRAFLISAGVLLVAFFSLGQAWQHELRGLMGVTQYSIPLVIASPFVAALIFVLLCSSDAAFAGCIAGLHGCSGAGSARAPRT